MTAIEVLAVISVVGTEYALQADVAPFVAVLFGVITGTFGGVMGDRRPCRDE